MLTNSPIAVDPAQMAAFLARKDLAVADHIRADLQSALDRIAYDYGQRLGDREVMPRLQTAVLDAARGVLGPFEESRRAEARDVIGEGRA